ncbi:MAG: leucine-rich repeat domain-containing protein, partial [Gemmatimonadota bacterium]|nr:leucine-rich repeat domain-containing protein [Gemmatimonadota bacterium]
MSRPTILALATLAGLACDQATTTEPASYTAEAHATADSSQSDRDALVALYRAAGGAGWRRSANWLSAAPLADWHGVIVDTTGAVTSIDLGRNHLVGYLPSELGTLKSLDTLDLSYNRITGEIPSELGALTSLDKLDLSYNRITGEIPSELGA